MKYILLLISCLCINNIIAAEILDLNPQYHENFHDSFNDESGDDYKKSNIQPFYGCINGKVVISYINVDQRYVKNMVKTNNDCN